MGGFLLAHVTDTDNPLDPTFPSPLEGWVVSYELISKWGSQDKEEFPSPLEVWVVSYTWNWVKKHPWAVVVSVPSRGMGGFLRGKESLLVLINLCFRPLSRYGWFPTPYLVSQKGNNTQDSSSLETILSIPYFPRAFS